MRNRLTRRTGWIAAVLLVFVAGAANADTAPRLVEVHLTDGTVLKGEVTARSAEDVTLRTEYGVVRVPAERLTPASRAALLAPRNLAGCESRVSELEARVAALEQENQDLRRRLASSPSSPRTLVSSPAAASPSDSALRYSLSSTGKRHNSRCRYYEPDKPCAANTGVACKVCGG